MYTVNTNVYSELLKCVCVSPYRSITEETVVSSSLIKGYWELNDVFANHIACVEVKNKADPILYRNNIHHGQTRGVYIHKKVCSVFVNLFVQFVHMCLLPFLGCNDFCTIMNILLYVCSSYVLPRCAVVDI